MKMVAAAILAISACACVAPQPQDMNSPTPAPQAPSAGPLEANCDASAAQSLAGQAATAELGADILRRTGGRTIRWIQPNQAVTMDYRTDRVNVELDHQNRIVRVTCG
jgi:hypothetical protein